MTMHFSTRGLSLMTVVACVFLSTAAVRGHAAGSPEGIDGGPSPNAALSPDQVVRIQLDALRENDPADSGIAIAFRFASPSNKSNTGPLPRFARMIKEGVYALMLDYVEADYSPVEVVGTRARQKVTLTGTSRIVTYVFYLSRQEHDACEGCWMTDAVSVERVATQSAQASPVPQTRPRAA
jgi:hypothetical protein